ncbi:hypothetical protein [Shewanella psychrotolerans]|uniref:hypothetical protein n=1 Tax=Shewanella psychrotolerans TaxID=2864206 RepID=UPI001C657099|nr:hypothetical protein [Shewanella psychrotolerans]QYK00629.1 hypothetical protein K0I62_14690 [Shewanella psychrotolerans]
MISTTSSRIALDDHSLGHLLYGLMLAFPLFLLPPILGLVINCSQKSHKMSQLLYSHIRWQRWSIVTMLSLLVLAYIVSQTWLAITLVVLSLFWFCHRTIKGWMALVDGQPI